MAKKKKMRKKKGIGHAKPGTTVTRKATQGPGKGDTVRFRANSSQAKNPGKLVPRRIVKDVAPKGTQKTIPKGSKALEKFKPRARRRRKGK